MTTTTDTRPWYRQFWPWFIIAFPLASIFLGIIMITVSVKGGDDPVSDDYYKEGLAINERLAQDRRAEELGMVAALAFDPALGDLVLTLEGNAPTPAALTLELIHPVERDLDETLVLQHIGERSYFTELNQVPQFRWYLQLQPMEDPQWRLNGEIDFRQGNEVTLGTP